MPNIERIIADSKTTYFHDFIDIFLLPDIFTDSAICLSVPSIVAPSGHIHPQKNLPRITESIRKIRAGKNIPAIVRVVKRYGNTKKWRDARQV